ncbi:MAG: SNF2 helicase associated domain-containing protein [Verrucomicrobia bacterium]|nr:SNF2 helicase associated domain-containing protein [Verrucomicrobiota bacterium]MBI3868692.1 SNF2 helicase associated domain-containing protein [Verrucomicrobiota bacterium]
MPQIELNEPFLAKIAGWEVVKLARALLATGRVLSSNWTPPRLQGVVQEGRASYRAGLIIKDMINIENTCTCRASREWGTLCAHSVAVGLHHLGRDKPQAAPAADPADARRSPRSVAPDAPLRALRTGPPSPGAQPLELFVILPPNLEAALRKGRVMVCFEVASPRGRTPLNALSTALAYSASDADRLLLDRLQDLSPGALPAMCQLDAEQLAALLKILVGHPQLTLGRSATVTVESTAPALDIAATLETDGRIALKRASGAASPCVLSGGGDNHWVYSEHRFHPLKLPRPLLSVFESGCVIPRGDVPVFLNRDWPALVSAGARPTNFTVDDFEVEVLSPAFSLRLVGGLAILHATLEATYGVRVIPLGRPNLDLDAWIPDPGNVRRYWTRDAAGEREAVACLTRHGFTGPDAEGRWQLNGQTEVLNFFARQYPKLRKAWRVTLEERLERSCAQNLQFVEPRLEVIPSGVQWFDLTVSYQASGGDPLSSADIQRLLRSGQSHARLPNGKFAVFDTEALDEFQEVLRDCDPQQLGSQYRMSSRQAAFLESAARDKGWTLNAPTRWRDHVRQQSGDALPECPPLGPLETVLRPYQRAGVAWLAFLRRNQFGGILADEMGLGKTLQTLAFLSARDRAAGDRGPSLVVCPTSLVFNWVHEASRFTPGLKTLAWHGGDRHRRADELAQSDLVITSYALARRDADTFRSIEFDTVILDEAQHIKNRATQNAQSVKSLRAAHRIVLTGTPMENAVSDLWSIFDFLMPGYLGSAQDFRDRYELPIGKARDAGAISRLSRRLRPFILRRLKREVAPELPARLEQISFCELSTQQRALYEQVLAAGRQEMLRQADAGGANLGQSRMIVLTTLLRLRQICCDPRLLRREADEPAGASGKVELFHELLDEAEDGGHRVLVFSQFTQMLALLRAELESREMEYCYLDGGTQDRPAVVERFQKGDAPVFLISLKAGGVGLNLTGADTVVHFDPWWNPAVEDQATDRAHRIGQTRVVTSYKLIARDTIEEKILGLQQKKRELIRAMGSEESFAETLTWEEIQSLLA